jgi:hypothetical protein
MQYSLRFTVFILFAIAFQLLGCSEDTDNDTATVERLVPEPIPPKPTPEDTFAKLKALFPKPIFDEDFTTLSEVTTSKTYLDFLAQEYRTEKPFKTLEEYLDVAKPDPERYKPFLKKFINKPNEEDIAIVHQMTLRYRCANVIFYQMVHNGGVVKAILDVLEKKLSVLEEAPTQAWLELHFPNGDFFKDFDSFVTETEREDAFLIQEQFEQHGTDNSLLWIALRNPALTAEILNNFTDSVVFLKWTSGDFFPPQP